MSKLRDHLLRAMAPGAVFHAPVWGNPRAMSEALRDVRRVLSDNDGGQPATNALQASLRRFAGTQTVASFTELKHVCYGVTVPVGENQWRLIDRAPLFQSLLRLVEQRSGQAKQYRRCYQGLLNGYFGFDKQTTSEAGQTNWTSLRTYLDQRLEPMLRATARSGLQLDWLKALAEHRNLLSDDPCSRYAYQLRSGQSEELRSLCAALGIASTSWVWDEALMAYVRAVCASTEDSRFLKDMPGVLDLANGRDELKLAEMLCTRATGLTVARYARCAIRPEHPDLRDTSLRWIGNPWVNRTAWDAHVQHEPAREMVEGWLKRRLIKDFFELLAHDGGADLRRLNYWLKWEPQITDMWFVLGSDARSNNSAAFKDLRERMVGRRRSLDDPNGQNNAFVMRIGPLLVIEFGVTGNACYAFAAADFKGDLNKALLSIHVLKQRAGATRLSHMSSWESRFDYELKKLLQSVPSFKGDLPPRPAHEPARHPAALPTVRRPLSAPAQALSRSLDELAARTRPAPAQAPQTPQTLQTESSAAKELRESTVGVIKSRCAHHGVEWEDNRSNKGAFWVLMPDRLSHPGFARILEIRGFKYAAGKGFWIKDGL